MHTYIYIHTYILSRTTYICIHTSNRQNYCNTYLLVLRLGLAEGCAKPSLPIGDNMDNPYLRLFMEMNK